MARPVSTLESHPQRSRIVEAIASGRAMTEISSWTDPPISRVALQRFKSRAIAEHDARVIAAKKAIANTNNHIEGVALEAVHKAALGIAADPFLSRVYELRADRQSVKDACLQATETPDLSTWAKLDGNDLKELELHARLAGRLDSAGAQVNVQIVIPATREPQATAIGEDEGDVLTIDIGSK